MSISFTKGFRFGPTRLTNGEVRTRLQRAILDGDRESFRNTLEQHAPEIAGQQRLYGVLVMTPDGMQTLLVNEGGERSGAGYVIGAGTPIDLLNVAFSPTGMTATDLDGHVWM